MNDTDTPGSTAPAAKTANAEKSAETSEMDPQSTSSAAETPQASEAPGSWFSRIFKGKKRSIPSFREDLADALSDDTTLHAFSAGEKAMLHNILRLQDVRVEDLMVPRSDIEAVDYEITLGDLLKLFEESGHSRMPVYSETLDDPKGMVHIRDVVAYVTRTAAMSKAEIAARKRSVAANLDLKKVGLEKPLSALKLVRKVLFVPPSMQAAVLMARMQATHIQMALVIDEYGGTEGLISLEDIVEVIVGDIEDEHDDEADTPLIEEKGEGIFIVDAKAEIDDVAAAVGSEFQAGELGEDVDTIGGLLFAIAGRVPVRGEVIDALGFEFRIIDADPRRLKRIEMTALKRRRPRKPA